MATNQRIFYATHGVKVDNTQLKGVQSVSLSSNFSLEPTFQLGQLTQIELYPNNPSIELTLTRALIGGPTFKIDVSDATVSTAESTLQRAIAVALGIDGGGGFSMKEAFISSYAVNFTTDGLFTEELTYVGESMDNSGNFTKSNDKNSHAPRRLDFKSSGLPTGSNPISASFNVNFNRESVFKLGDGMKPFLRSVTFPIEASLTVTTLLSSSFALPKDPVACQASNDPTQTISIGTSCGYNVTLRNARLSAINYSGGDTGGGNAEVQYTYTSFNDFKIG